MQLGLFSLLPLLGPLVALFNQIVQLVAAGLFPTTGFLLLSAIIQVDFSPHGWLLLSGGALMLSAGLLCPVETYSYKVVSWSWLLELLALFAGVDAKLCSGLMAAGSLMLGFQDIVCWLQDGLLYPVLEFMGMVGCCPGLVLTASLVWHATSWSLWYLLVGTAGDAASFVLYGLCYFFSCWLPASRAAAMHPLVYGFCYFYCFMAWFVGYMLFSFVVQGSLFPLGYLLSLYILVCSDTLVF